MPRIALLTGLMAALAVAGVAVVGAATAGSSGSVYTYKSTMTAGFEVPKPKGAAGARACSPRP